MHVNRGVSENRVFREVTARPAFAQAAMFSEIPPSSAAGSIPLARALPWSWLHVLF
jgi:hypothetical protein